MRIAIEDDQQLLRDALRELLAKEAPLDRVSAWDRDSHYPTELFQLLVDQGYYALPFPEELGGSGLGPIEMSIVGEELGAAGLEIAGGYGLTVFPGLNLLEHGTAAQQQRYLEPMLRGETRFAVAISEPDAGSDAAGVRTTATRDGDGFRLRGQKLWTTGAGQRGTVLHVLARTGPPGGRRDGLAVFLIPADAPGIQIRRLETVGRHLLGTNEIYLDDVPVAADQVLGEVDRGWAVMTSGLAYERAFAAAQYAGAARTVLDMTVEYTRERSQFGRPLASFQAVAHGLADVANEIDAARLQSYAAANLLADGRPAGTAAAMAKLRASEALQFAADRGMQYLGGYGYSKEYAMERLWREARSVTVTAGTSEIQRTIIAQSLGLGSRAGR